MIQSKCSKCGADLILHEGYGVCSNCGEIIGFDIEEEKEEVIKENVEETEVIEEVSEPSVSEEPQEEIEEIIETAESAENIENDVAEYEEAVADEVQDELLPEEKEEAKVIEEVAEENTITEETKKPKKKKTPIIILVVVILCILAVLGGYFISKATKNTADTNADDVLPEENITAETEEPKAIDEEFEEEPTAEPELNEESVEEPEKTPAPAPVKTETPKKETVKKEDAVISETPSISYRIRKSADDSTTQIGAFSDLDRAKAFATTHAADGYKVFDMYGNLIFQP